MGWVADLEYVITGRDDHWRLWWQGRCCGTFPSRRAALGMATYEAGRVRLLGHHVRILVRRPNGGFRAVPLPARAAVEAVPVPPRPVTPARSGMASVEPGPSDRRRARAAARLAPA